MTKITIINCIIVAVCVFQAANAGLFGNLPLSGSLDNINKQISNTLGNGLGDIKDKIKEVTDGATNEIQNREKEALEGAKKLGNEIKNREKEALEGAKKLGNEIGTRGKEALEGAKKLAEEAIDNIKNGLKNAKNELQNGPACTNAYTEIENVIETFQKQFNNCVVTEKSEVSENINNLTNAISKITADFPNILQCDYTNISNISSCFNEVSQIIPTLTAEFENIVNEAYKLIDIFPHMGNCLQNVIVELSNDSLGKLINNAKQCYNNVLQHLNHIYKLL